MENASDIIELILPFKAEYVSAARLLASGVASRIGLDIDVIEDIKVAISEVCNKLVQLGSRKVLNYKIIFIIFSDKLTVKFDCEDKSLRCVFESKEDELGISIINALMDDVELCSNNEYILSMTKVLEGK